MSDNTSKAWVGWTYVGYIMIVYVAFIGVPSYAVFVLGHNPCYLLLGALSFGAYSPWRWFAIWDGIERPYSSKPKTE